MKNKPGTAQDKLTLDFYPISSTMEHKIALLGLYSAGKKAIVVRYVSNYFLEDDSFLPSVEDSYRKQIVCDDIVCVLSLQYAIGQEEYHAFLEQQILWASGFMLVYHLTRFIQSQGAQQISNGACRKQMRSGTEARGQHC